MIKLAQFNAPESVKSTPLAVYLPEATDQSLEELRRKLLESGFTITRDYSNTHQFRVVIATNNELIRTGRAGYKRTISGSITVSIYTPNDQLIWSDATELTYNDLVNSSQIDPLTTDWPLSRFNKVENRRSDRKLLKWIQPLLISGAIATTVVLLFSVRSQ